MRALDVVGDTLRPYYLKWLYWKVRPAGRAGYLDACWSKPPVPLSDAMRDALGAPTERPDLLFFPMTDWHARIQRSQHLAATFAEMGSRCFYLNPHLGREFPQPYPLGGGVRCGLLGPRTLEAHVHLPREPFYHHRLLTARESARIAAGLGRVLRHAGAERVVQIVSFPLWMDAAARLKRERGFPIVYDCHDLLSGFRAVSRDIVAAEAGALEAADLIWFTSEWLRDETLRGRPELRARSVVARNAAELREPPARSRGPRARPVAGYAGSLDFWFDTEAVALAAERRPDWDFELLGRIESPRIRELDRLPNVRLEGEVPYADLPRRIAAFDAALIPFLRMPLTLATNPVKLYEYFSFGLPVVATRLPETALFGDLVYLYDSPSEFPALLDRAMAERDPALAARRESVARENTWRARCEQLSACFDPLLRSIFSGRG